MIASPAKAAIGFCAAAGYLATSTKPPALRLRSPEAPSFDFPLVVATRNLSHSGTGGIVTNFIAEIVKRVGITERTGNYKTNIMSKGYVAFAVLLRIVV